MPDQQRHAESSSGVTRRRLNPDLIEGRFPQDPSVANTVEGNAAGQAEIGKAGLLVGRRDGPEHDLLGHLLDRGGQVHLALSQRSLGLAWGSVKELMETRAGHGQALAIVEVGHVHAEGTVLLEVDKVFEDSLGKARFAVRGQAHQLVFTGIHTKAAVVGKSGIEQSK